MEMLDCMGLACPSPVIKTKDLLESKNPDTLEVLVDNEAASQNVSRFLKTKGFEVRVRTQNGGFAVEGSRQQGEETAACEIMDFEAPMLQDARTLVMVATDHIGSGDDVLGGKLMLSFISTLKEMEGLWRLVLVNNGVKLSIEGAETLGAIQELEASGVSVLVCGTCLTFFDLLDRKRVGETTNMLDIVTSMQVAGKVITFG